MVTTRLTPAPPAVPPAPLRRPGSLAGLLRRNSYLFALVLAVILLVLNVALQPGFRIGEQFAQLAPLAIVAMANAPAIISGRGGIDMSIGPNMVFANILFVAWLSPAGLPPVASVLITIAASACIGALNGILTVYLRLSPVVVTLSMYFILMGVNTKLAPSPVMLQDSWIKGLGSMAGGFPVAAAMLLIPLALWLAVSRSGLGRSIYAVGGNDATAFSAGVDVGQVRIAAYATGGLLAGLGGISLTALISSADATASASYTLVSLAAVAIGGTSLMGGRGGLLGPLLGSACIYLLQSLLAALQVPQTWLKVTYGLLLLAAVIFGSLIESTGKGAKR